MASLYDRTKRAKPTCQDVMAFTAVELEFAMASSEKIANVRTHFGLEIFL